MTHIEKNRLDYAWRVLGDSECCSGVSKWPGYLGGRYEDRRVLIVGAVHNAESLFTPEIKKLAAVACDWRRGAVSDERYLSTVRWAYEYSKRGVQADAAIRSRIARSSTPSRVRGQVCRGKLDGGVYADYVTLADNVSGYLRDRWRVERLAMNGGVVLLIAIACTALWVERNGI